MTAILILAHAFKTNKEFDPITLYVGTVLLDALLIKYLFSGCMG